MRAATLIAATQSDNFRPHSARSKSPTPPASISEFNTRLVAKLTQVTAEMVGSLNWFDARICLLFE